MEVLRLFSGSLPDGNDYHPGDHSPRGRAVRQTGPAWLVVLVSILAMGNVPRALYSNQPGQAFLSSGAIIVSLTTLFGIALYPNMLVSSLDPSYSLTIYNAASSESTLKLMRNIAFLGLPFVLSYSAVVFWIFRGKVKLDETSY